MNPVPLLTLVTDDILIGDRDWVSIVNEALIGGISAIQFRHKNATDDDFIRLGKIIKDLCSKFSTPFIVNDRVNCAKILASNGVHVGRGDMSPKETREILGENIIIGTSLDTRYNLELDDKENINYYGVSTFSTSTKPEASYCFGLEGISTLKNKTNIPIVAIGGITKLNVENVIKAGADGVAVVSEIINSDNISSTVSELLNIIIKCKNER